MSNQKIYEMVTNIICERLEQGIIPWHRPWKGGVAEQNYVSKKPYRGINQLLTSMQGYEQPYWVTMNQANKLGGLVRGKSTPIIFWKVIEVKDEDAEDGKKKIHLLRYYRAWNIEQCEGIDFKTPNLEVIDFEPVERCEEMIACYTDRPKVVHREQRAYYSPVEDFINMPKKNSFKSVETYYSTLFHELVHSTGHSGRLGRDLLNHFGDEKYSKEELVAELGACFLCTIAGIAPPVIDNSTAYIKSWLGKLKDDKGLIIHASANAQKAVDYMLEEEIVEEETEDEMAS